MKKILVTGGAGGVGAFVCRRFVEAGHNVRVFDLPSANNKKVFADGEKGIELFWGDITDEKQVRDAARGVDEVVHLAALVVPATEENPALARKINVDGTRNVARAALEESKQAGKQVPMRFSSSVTVYGITAGQAPPVPADQAVNPNNVYAETKVAAEEVMRDSGLKWTIYRFGAAQYLQIRPGSFSQMRIIPPENRIEFVHIADIADAFVNSIDNEETYGKTFILAGGPKCQLLYRDQLLRTFGMLGFPAPNWKKFTKEPFCLDWYDTSESQRILKFQSRDFDAYLADFRKNLGAKYYLFRYLAAPAMQLLRIRL